MTVSSADACLTLLDCLVCNIKAGGRGGTGPISSLGSWFLLSSVQPESAFLESLFILLGPELWNSASSTCDIFSLSSQG